MDVRRVISALGLVVVFALILLGLAVARVTLDWLGIGWVYWVVVVGFLAWYVWKMAGDLVRYKGSKS